MVACKGEEPFYRPPYHQLRHPLIFYYGHPAVFYINKLRVAGMLDHGINDHFESIFEVVRADASNLALANPSSFLSAHPSLARQSLQPLVLH